MPEDIRVLINEKLSKTFMVAPLLSNLIFIDENSKHSPACSDPKHFPFYYHLGKCLSPKNLLVVGIQLGISVSCFLRSCTSVFQILGFQPQISKGYYSTRFAKRNIKSISKSIDVFLYHGRFEGSFFSEKFLRNNWDLVFVDIDDSYDRTRAYLSDCWQQLSEDGYIVIDNLKKSDSVKNAFFDFCKIQNRNHSCFDTRYGIGLVQK